MLVVLATVVGLLILDVVVVNWSVCAVTGFIGGVFDVVMSAVLDLVLDCVYE